MKKDYKVEMKGSLFEVSFQSGEYSDWYIEYYIFSGNTEEEVWEFIKIWAKQGGLNDEWVHGLIWNKRKFQFSGKEEFEWHNYRDCLEVKIDRANVIYVHPKKLLSDSK